MPDRRWAAHAAMLSLCAALLPSAAHAQSAPPAGEPRKIEVILPYAAGGGVDAMGRAFAREASRLTGDNWIVVNRDGAGGMLGFAALANAAPNGQTLVFSPASPLVIAPHMNRSMPFQPARIEPVCQVFENVFAMAVRQDSPIQSMRELIARAKVAPGRLSYGHAGAGSVPHLSVAALEQAFDARFNPIPFRGDGAMLPQLLGGELDFGVPAISSIGGKNLRVLTVLSDKPHPGAPDAPNLKALGYTPVTPGLNGLYAPVGTPKATLNKLQGLCQQVTTSPEFGKTAQTLQQSPAYLPGAAFKQRLALVSRENAQLVSSMKLEKN